MNRRLIVPALLVVIVAAIAPAHAQKPTSPELQAPSAAPCPPGATSLCIPLDATFTVVRFDGPGGNGPADPLDPCQRNDDDTSVSLALPFTFDLYGTSHTSVFINNNGNISFGAAFSTFTPSGFPVSGFPMVAPLWSDVDTRAPTSTVGGVVYYKLEANRLTVIWDHVGYYDQHDGLFPARPI